MTDPNGLILIVEDIPNILELLAITLRFKGYNVITATNGLEALEIIAKTPPSLIITDILMPKMDGFSMTQQLRTNPETQNIPIVFLSATYVTPEDKEFAQSLGAMGFLEKPVDTTQFLQTVSELMTSPQSSANPLDKQNFLLGYRERLESKLRYKNLQISRTQRLLTTLPEDQKPAFETLLSEALNQRDQIQKELDDLYNQLTRPPQGN